MDPILHQNNDFSKTDLTVHDGRIDLRGTSHWSGMPYKLNCRV